MRSSIPLQGNCKSQVAKWLRKPLWLAYLPGSVITSFIRQWPGRHVKRRVSSDLLAFVLQSLGLPVPQRSITSLGIYTVKT